MSALGLVVLYSASEQSFDTILHQGLRLMVGLVAMIIVAKFLPIGLLIGLLYYISLPYLYW